MLNPRKKDKIQITIRNIGSHGEGIGDYHGYTIFVEDALPGERVEVELFECKKRYARAHLIKILTSSLDRVKPICPLFEKCGGCQLMHLSYSKQLEVKRQRVIDTFQRIGKMEDVNVNSCVSSPSTISYRNKIQCPVRNTPQGISIGLYARSSHELIEVDKCYIHCPIGEEVYKNTSEIIKLSGIQAYEPLSGKGELRHLLIKSALNTQEILVIVVTNQPPSVILKKIAQKIKENCSQVKGVIHNLNTGQNNVILGKTYTTMEGSSFIHERLGQLSFKVSPASFFQVNTAQAELLYLKVLELATLKGDEVVLDAYCGVGTLSLLFSTYAKKVIGIECVPEAIEDAKENARLNQIYNTDFICADAETAIHKLYGIDIALLNPPRKGCESSFLIQLINLKPKTVIYVSCDPATLARDLSFLCNSCYQIDSVHPFDMFPQTMHVETVVKLSLIINS